MSVSAVVRDALREHLAKSKGVPAGAEASLASLAERTDALVREQVGEVAGQMAWIADQLESIGERISALESRRSAQT